MFDITTCICLLFIFTAANHMGLVNEMERIINHKIPIVDCPKCATFWSTLIYLIWSTKDYIGAMAMSFFFAYSALWVELAMCAIDNFYLKVYEKFISNAASDTATDNTDDGDAERPVSDMRKKQQRAKAH